MATLIMNQCDMDDCYNQDLFAEDNSEITECADCQELMWCEDHIGICAGCSKKICPPGYGCKKHQDSCEEKNYCKECEARQHESR